MTVTTNDASRPPSRIDEIADQFVRDAVALNPTEATQLGIPGYDHLMADYSPAGHDARAGVIRDALAALEGVEPADDVDRVTKAAMMERLGIERELADSGERLAELNVIDSPAQHMRDIFALMPTDTEEAWEAIGERMSAIQDAVDSYEESLALAAERGNIAALRQIEAVIKQADDLADFDTSIFTDLAKGAKITEADGEERELKRSTRRALENGAMDARQAYADLAQYLSEMLAMAAPEDDAVGAERYERFSRYFLGAKVDLDETYEWGREELARIIAEQEAVAAELYGPGTSIAEAMDRLDTEQQRLLHGTDALKAWMQKTSDQAVAELGTEHFDIPEPVRTLECCIAPTQTGGIYYTGPSDDFSRPGRMWWSVPAGVSEFTTWREKTTVYHEGVPGHHLQVAQTVYRKELLNLWRRQYCWISGHGEGWALYAERLMADLGYLADPGDRMGMLDGQRLRAARVVLDIGVHLSKPCPDEWGGGTWDTKKAWPFLVANANMDKKILAFELDRYLGWPGQAPSYKIGERLWLQARDDARAAAAARGEDFDLKAFHRRALDLGSVGLDLLRDEITR
ncbi:hypothetical protein BSZ39_06340 [Bowdeniella nasicola]|uniref:DUF885 domain-containing protein n=1 Tax=Bowdeniella nasicola TaxID=208480 RepID=A0A1Q5Q2E3_9ACTO|nr:hypothetical protein BSZ39_06340 [Bowdeniella nasicola]